MTRTLQDANIGSPKTALELAIARKLKNCSEEESKALLEQKFKFDKDYNAREGKKPFVLDAAIEFGLVTAQDKEWALANQAFTIIDFSQKVLAALEAIPESLEDHNSFSHLKVHWGNNGKVNPSSAKAAMPADAASAAANAAKLIMQIANLYPDLAKNEIIQTGMKSASALVGFLLEEDVSRATAHYNSHVRDHETEWLGHIDSALSLVAERHADFQPYLDEYKKNRIEKELKVGLGTRIAAIACAPGAIVDGASIVDGHVRSLAQDTDGRGSSGRQ